MAQWLERPLVERKVVGSSPIIFEERKDDKKERIVRE